MVHKNVDILAQCGHKSVGQLVDELADMYFASGMDAYHANIRACIDVAKLHIEAVETIGRLVDHFSDLLTINKTNGGNKK